MQDLPAPDAAPAPGAYDPRATAVALGSSLFIVYLAVLVHVRRPLPGDDLSIAGAVGIAFGLACLAVLVGLLRLPVFSFSFLVAFATVLFSMSVFVIYLFEGTLAFGGFHVLYKGALARGIPIVMLALAAFVFGSALARLRGAPPRPMAVTDPHPAVDATRKVAFVLYWVVLVAVLVASLRGPGIFSAISHGYTGGAGFSDLRKLGSLPVVVTAGGNWFLPWLSFILVATSRDRGEFATSTLFAIATCVLNLLTGDRGTTLLTIAVWLQLRYLLGFSVRWRRLALLGALALSIIVIWPIIRTVPVRDWRPSVLAEVLEDRFSSGDFDSRHVTLIGHLFDNMAPRYQPIMVSCHYVPDLEPFRMGADYVASAVTAVPFIARRVSGFFPPSPSNWYMDKIDPNFWTGRAFNQIAEAYLQGGAVAVILVYVLLGWYLTWVWGRVRGETDLRLLAFHALAVVAVYKWIGNYSLGVGRTLLWAGVLVYGLPALYRWVRRTAPSRRPAADRRPAG